MRPSRVTQAGEHPDDIDRWIRFADDEVDRLAQTLERTRTLPG